MESLLEDVPMSCRGKTTAPATKASTTSRTDVYMKIHALFAQLGFAEAAAHVDLPDQVTLCAVEHYLALQQGSVWQSMADKFADEGLDPTEDDAARIRAGVKKAAAVRQFVEEKQQVLMQQYAAQLMQAQLDFVRYVAVTVRCAAVLLCDRS